MFLSLICVMVVTFYGRYVFFPCSGTCQSVNKFDPWCPIHYLGYFITTWYLPSSSFQNDILPMLIHNNPVFTVCLLLFSVISKQFLSLEPYVCLLTVVIETHLSDYISSVFLKIELATPLFSSLVGCPCRRHSQ